VGFVGYKGLFLGLGTVILLCGILGIFTVKDSASLEKKGSLKDIVYGFKPSVVKANPQLYVTLLIVGVYGIACQIFMPYLILYYEVTLGMSDYVLIMAPAIIIASIVTALYGKTYDKFGFTKSIILPIILLILGYVLLFIFTGKVLVFIGSLLMMCGYLAGMAMFGAKIRDLTPENKSGMLQGVRIFSQVLVPGVIGPFIGKQLLSNAEKIKNTDGTESFVPNINIFIGALVAIAVLALAMLIYNIIKNKIDKRAQRC
jgi:MFS family permease